MLNHYPWWKNLFIASVVLFGLVYALPNLYAPDAAIQITAEDSASKLSDVTAMKAVDALARADIDLIRWERKAGQSSVVYRLRDAGQQLRARAVVAEDLGAGYVVALSKEPNTPSWLRSLGAGALSLGLDLSGGVHFLLEVDVESYVNARMDNAMIDMRRTLLQGRIRPKVNYFPKTRSIIFVFKNNEDLAKAEDLLKNSYMELNRSKPRNDDDSKTSLVFNLSGNELSNYLSYAVDQNVTILRNRVNELGVAEPLVQRQGSNRIIVELPGVQDTASAKRILGKFANLEFRLEANNKTPSFARERFEFRNANSNRAPIWLEDDLIITGDSVANASSGFDENAQPMVSITLDSDGGVSMNKATRSNVGRGMGVLFVERRTRTADTNSIVASAVEIGEQYEEKRIISLAVIRSVLGTQFQIEGLDSVAESAELALLLRSGALAAPLKFVEERTVGPSLGKENIRSGLRSVILGFVLVLAFMLFWYRGFGVIANIALTTNLVLLIAVMSLLSATLTLPGIAGIVLTVGMAVDANVLIYSRIYEEFRSGLSPQQAISSGYDRALITILDANITTLLMAFILYLVGTGPVRGFAITLSIGIITSMFTAVLGTRALVNIFYGRRQLKTLKMGLLKG